MDSAIAVNSRTYQLQNKAEQEQLKRLVLQNERRQEQSEKQGESSVSHSLSAEWQLIAL
jgi:regulator of nonsense transcripts 2